MSGAFKVTLFGIASGLIWSLIAVILHAQYLYNPYESISIVLLIGALTGIAVSFALKVPLMKFGKVGGIIFGVLAFPLGIFIFGFAFTLFEMAVGNFYLGGMADDNASLTMPFRMALSTMFFGSLYSSYLLPLAILTTFFLRMVIRSGNNNLSLKH